jgi:hypothetical protein
MCWHSNLLAFDSSCPSPPLSTHVTTAPSASCEFEWWACEMHEMNHYDIERTICEDEYHQDATELTSHSLLPLIHQWRWIDATNEYLLVRMVPHEREEQGDGIWGHSDENWVRKRRKTYCRHDEYRSHIETDQVDDGDSESEVRMSVSRRWNCRYDESTWYETIEGDEGGEGRGENSTFTNRPDMITEGCLSTGESIRTIHTCIRVWFELWERRERVIGDEIDSAAIACC